MQEELDNDKKQMINLQNTADIRAGVIRKEKEARLELQKQLATQLSDSRDVLEEEVKRLSYEVKYDQYALEWEQSEIGRLTLNLERAQRKITILQKEIAKLREERENENTVKAEVLAPKEHTESSVISVQPIPVFDED